MKSFNKLRDAAEAKTDQGKLFPGINKSTSFQIDPRRIKAEPGFNARDIDKEHVEGFKASIMAGATIPPLIVKMIDNEVILRDGEHRWTAYVQLIEAGEDIKLVDCIEFKGNDADAVALLLTSSQGKELTPLQRAAQYQKLTKFGWSIAEIANRVGRSVSHVGQALTLAGTDSEIQAMVTRNDVSATTALAAVRKHGGGAKKQLAEDFEKAKTIAKAKTQKSGKEKRAKVTKKVIELSLEQAIREEMKGGAKSEESCPRCADLIAYLRFGGQTANINSQINQIGLPN